MVSGILWGGYLYAHLSSHCYSGHTLMLSLVTLWLKERASSDSCVLPLCFPGKHMDASHTQPSERGSCINLLWGARNKCLFTPDRLPREDEGFHQSPAWWTNEFGLTFWSLVRSYVEDHKWPPKELYHLKYPTLSLMTTSELHPAILLPVHVWHPIHPNIFEDYLQAGVAEAGEVIPGGKKSQSNSSWSSAFQEGCYCLMLWFVWAS